VRDQVEFSAAIQRAMKEKRLTPERLREMLGVSEVMLHKIICGDVIPSRHLEKQMTEILGGFPQTGSSVLQDGARAERLQR